MLVNPDSVHSTLFPDNDSGQKQLIFHLFKLLVIGGPLCQPDTDTARYDLGHLTSVYLYDVYISVYDTCRVESVLYRMYYTLPSILLSLSNVVYVCD